MRLETILLPSTPYKKVLDVGTDYYTLFCFLEKKFDNCYIFESLSDEKRKDVHTSFGADPLFTVRAKGNRLFFTGNLKILGVEGESVDFEVDNPYQFLKTFFPYAYEAESREGGLVGYVSYEAINYFEPSISLQEHDDFHQFQFGFYDHGLIFHSLTGTLEYYYYFEDRSKALLDSIEEHLNANTIKEEELIVQDLGSDTTKEEYYSVMKNVFYEINKGNTFQVEVGMKNKYRIKGRKMKIYDHLREINPSPYMIYIKFGQEEIIGASPEILVNSTKGYVITTPTAGTVGRGKSAEEDEKLVNEMLSNPKEVAEHSMLVDLHRNDLGRIAVIGSVEVEELMHIISFSHVQHIVSKISCRLDPVYDSFDILSAICPGGVLTGVPKIETMKIIDTNEKEPRGPYGGAVGRFSFNGDCTFALPIRTLFCSGEHCYTQTCSGVVLDSIIEKEFEEIQNKVAAMKLAIKSAQ